MVDSLADRDVAELLRHRPLEPVERFVAASNATLLCELGDGIRAVYKPRRGEAPLWDFPEGTLYRREVAAYEVSRSLGWDAVPVTVIREEGPLGPGSIQLHVPHDPEEHYFALLERGDEQILDQLRRMVVFDLLINNADRKGGHVLRDADGRVWLVDHGVCFHREPKLRTVAWEFAGEPLPSDLVDDTGRLARDLRGGGDGVGARRAGLLDPLEIDALRRRAEAVIRLDALPDPAGPRPFPWPLL
ncbi:MAG: SCO1664 family protein [Actinobacteria bacterium]|nr:SCO1664 family protein [Actinomycetota bacterium]